MDPREPASRAVHTGPVHSSSTHGIEQVEVPAGRFLMGDHFGEGYPADGETPVHAVRLDGFSMDATTVTVDDFRRFVEQTAYVTEAERFGFSAVFHLELRARRLNPAGANPVPGTAWWVTVPGACWHAPLGPGSRADEDHPVVHVSWNDAQAYCAWAGRRLPHEAQWEYAARGGLQGHRYAWGDELVPGGEHHCNIFQGRFPVENTIDDGFLSTAPVRTFPANGFGLFQMAGNVWEWCQDWFLPRYYRRSPEENPPGPPFGEGRVMRGGSFLCHDSYCNRYRVAARSRNSPDSSSSNCGFRTVG
jgi:sulfatase modifying factor 1